MCRTRTLLFMAFLTLVVAGAPARSEGPRTGLRAHLIGMKGNPIQKLAPVQKAVPIQKMTPMQKGPVVQKGGSSCAAGPRCGCGSVPKCGGCGSCNRCCLIPALLNGVGNMIEGIFSCNRCCATGCSSKSYSKSGGSSSCSMFSRRLAGGSSCGCSGGKGGKSYGGGYAPLRPAQPADPFIDDDLTPPPVPVSEARVLRKAPVYRAATVVSAPAKTPRRISISRAKPLGKVVRVSSHSEDHVVVRANNRSVCDDVPDNPLRD